MLEATARTPHRCPDAECRKPADASAWETLLPAPAAATLRQLEAEAALPEVSRQVPRRSMSVTPPCVGCVPRVAFSTLLRIYRVWIKQPFAVHLTAAKCCTGVENVLPCSRLLGTHRAIIGGGRRSGPSRNVPSMQHVRCTPTCKLRKAFYAHEHQCTAAVHEVLCCSLRHVRGLMAAASWAQGGVLPVSDGGPSRSGLRGQSAADGAAGGAHFHVAGAETPLAAVPEVQVHLSSAPHPPTRCPHANS